MAGQQELGFGSDAAGGKPGALTRSLAEAWTDLPGEWLALCKGLEAEARAVAQRVDEDVRTAAVGPARPFLAFERVKPQDVRLLILGQDPYPTPGDACGLAFSSLQRIPPSMRNVYKAFEAHLPGFTRPKVANLEHWAEQGVLLLNTALTVRLGEIGSHMDVGWQPWTTGVLRALYRDRLAAGRPVPVAWLWGRPAQAFFDTMSEGLALPAERVLRTRHPSNDFKQDFARQAATQLAQLQVLLDPPIRW